VIQNWWAIAWPVGSGLLVALLATWVVYRFQRREEREGVLSALIAELQLHEAWVGQASYPKGVWAGGYSTVWWKGKPGETDNVVFKLSMIATDNAIQVGPALFINRDLVRALVNYRQRAQQLNQLIDDMAAFRATAQLWLQAADQGAKTTREMLWTRLDSLAGLVHEGGIGDHAGDGANYHYHELRDALRAERTSGCWRRWAWFWFGLSKRATNQPDSAW
jgi:hypothetical protein